MAIFALKQNISFSLLKKLQDESLAERAFSIIVSVTASEEFLARSQLENKINTILIQNDENPERPYRQKRTGITHCQLRDNVKHITQEMVFKRKVVYGWCYDRDYFSYLSPRVFHTFLKK